MTKFYCLAYLVVGMTGYKQLNSHQKLIRIQSEVQIHLVSINFEACV